MAKIEKTVTEQPISNGFFPFRLRVPSNGNIPEVKCWIKIAAAASFDLQFIIDGIVIETQNVVFTTPDEEQFISTELDYDVSEFQKFQVKFLNVVNETYIKFFTLSFEVI